MLLQSVRLLSCGHFKNADMPRKRKACKNIPSAVFSNNMLFIRIPDHPS